MEAYFFQENLSKEATVVALDEANARHCIQVLRMKKGEAIRLTDGKGNLAIAAIEEADKKRCLVRIRSLETTPEPQHTGFSIGIAFTKSNERNEWLLEKLTEIGTENIFPLLSEHGERDKFNAERYQKILIAALLQSQQNRLPVLHTAQKLESFLTGIASDFKGQKFIAHCREQEGGRVSFPSALQKNNKCLLLIGPEGDFSSAEINKALQNGFQPVHFGSNRLRTETAGIYACAAYQSFLLAQS